MNNHPDDDFLCDYTPASDQDNAPPVDWDLIAEIFPAFIGMLCWFLWSMFLLVPALFGLHHTTLFSTANNTVFVLMGFVICIALHTAIKAGHGGRAVFFAVGISLLSFWF